MPAVRHVAVTAPEYMAQVKRRLSVEYTALERPVAAGWLPRRSTVSGGLKPQTTHHPVPGLFVPVRGVGKADQGVSKAARRDVSLPSMVAMAHGSESHGTDGGKTFNRCGFFKGFHKKNPSSGAFGCDHSTWWKWVFLDRRKTFHIGAY